MSQLALYSKDNNNVRVIKVLEKNIMLDKNSPFSNLLRKIKNIISTQNYTSMIIKTFMVVRQAEYRSAQKVIFRSQDMKNEIFLVHEEVM